MDCFKLQMKTYLLIISLLFASSLMAQSLRDSLYGGKLKADTGPRQVVTDEGPLDQPRIARPDRVGATGFQMAQELQHHWSTEILDGELINRAFAPGCREPEQQLYCVPV